MRLWKRNLGEAYQKDTGKSAIVDGMEVCARVGSRGDIIIADVVILIINLSGRLGVDPEMLMRAVRSKLEINREREWIKYPDGTYRHRKGGE